MDTRFVTALESTTLESLGIVSAHYGPRPFIVLNLSEGGAALKFADEDELPKDFKVGAQIDVSMELQKKVFPLTLIIRGVVGARLHCQFQTKSPAFDIALKEFFVPKSLGLSLGRNESLSDHPEVQALVSDSEWHEVWVAPNQTGLFLWFGEEDALLRALLVSKDLAWEWRADTGSVTGHRTLGGKGETPDQAFEIAWDREASASTKAFVSEILISWLGMGDDSRAWVERLLDSEAAATGAPLMGCRPLLRRIRGA
ncbi:MAG TPA: PilZ domain-containing protein [Bdellovibrionota bacterium]|nr:PilZ domain-containing protein [Bdellovibrionota bacterium]